MRCLNRNKRPIWYALYKGRKEITDANGYATGQYELEYGNPMRADLNVSAARGETATRQFGEDESYDKVIVAENSDFPIDEYSVFWIDTTPKLDRYGHLLVGADGETETPHDYTVTRVARSLNGVAYAVRKVNVSG